MAKRYRYVMEVVEEVHYTTAIESERKLSYDEVRDACETRRANGGLSLKGVAEVDMWIDSAYEDGAEIRDGAFAEPVGGSRPRRRG